METDGVPPIKLGIYIIRVLRFAAGCHTSFNCASSFLPRSESSAHHTQGSIHLLPFSQESAICPNQEMSHLRLPFIIASMPY